MDIRKVKKLIELLEESGIDELEIREGEESVRISRHSKQPAYAQPMYAPAMAPAPAATPVAAAGGEALYKQACAVCHAAGVAGAPKFGDKAAWAPRLALGVDGLTASVIKGKGAMPPKGGSAASDAEIKAAVEYMTAAAK